MKTCPRCAEEVQDEAEVCRYCSHKFLVGEQINDGFKQLGCLGFGAIFVVIALVVNKCDGTAVPSPPVPTMAQAERTVTEEGLVKARLRDPASAVFHHLSGGCGYVNSKNGFGGMSGDRRYIVGANDKVVFREDGKHRAFDIVWQQHCIEGRTS